MTNYYNDTAITEAPEVTMENFDYIPAAVTKSSSLTSKESLTSRSSFDDINTSNRPSTGLKIIFKRQSENNYEIKPSNFQDEPSQISNDSWLTDPKPNNDSNVLPNGKRIPRRQSARKVKFIFSDHEEIDQVTPVKRKRTTKTIKKATNNHMIPVEQPQILPQILPQFYQGINNNKSHYKNLESEDSEDDMYQELLLKNMPQNYIQNQILQTQYFLNALRQNVVPPVINDNNIDNNIKKTSTINSNKKTGANSSKRNKKKRQRQQPSKAVTRSQISQKIRTAPLSEIQEKTSNQKVLKQENESETLFLQDELVKSSLLEKHRVLCNQPFVKMEHSEPFPIALVENETNIVETKALLFLHLFQSLSCPCIGCPECHTYMTCAEFSKHIHLDEDDTETLIDPKSYKILPYRMDDEELSEEALNTWKIFGKRYTSFKQKQSQVIKSEPIKATTIKTVNNEKSESISRDVNNNFIPNKNVQKDNPIQFSEWDYKEDDVFHISHDRLQSDQTCIVESTKSECDLEDEEVHYFMEEKDDLFLSEDESSQDDNSHKVKSPIDTIINHEISTKNPNTQDVRNLINDLIDHIESESFTSNSAKINLEKAKHSLRTKHLSYNEESIDETTPKPTLLERYFNLYDNLTNDMLLYICENEFTVIPDSFVLYVNNKREINLRELKLSSTSYYQSKWLENSLNLECRNRYD